MERVVNKDQGFSNKIIRSFLEIGGKFVKFNYVLRRVAEGKKVEK